MKRAPTRFPRPGKMPRVTVEAGDYIGLDECGRGSLAGPMVLAAVAIKTGVVDGVRDSKTLPRDRIPLLARAIIDKALFHRVAVMTPQYIDLHGINGAWDKGASEILEQIQKECDWQVVIDGDRLPAGGKNLTAFPKADSLVYQVSAASIIAKAKQLACMAEADQQYPQYEFGDNAGYCTRRHIELLKKFGPCPIHRKSFRPVSNPDNPITSKEELEFNKNKVLKTLGELSSVDTNAYVSPWENQFLSDVEAKVTADKKLSSREMFFFNAISRRRKLG